MDNKSPTSPDERDSRFLVGMVGLSFLTLIALVNAVSLARGYEFEYEGLVGPLIMFAAVVVSCMWLPLGVMLNVGPHRSRLIRLFFGGVLLLAGAVASVFWMVVPLLVLSGNLYYDHASPRELAGAGLVTFAVTVVVGLVWFSLLSVARSD